MNVHKNEKEIFRALRAYAHAFCKLSLRSLSRTDLVTQYHLPCGLIVAVDLFLRKKKKKLNGTSFDECVFVVSLCVSLAKRNDISCAMCIFCCIFLITYKLSILVGEPTKRWLESCRP